MHFGPAYGLSAEENRRRWEALLARIVRAHEEAGTPDPEEDDDGLDREAR